MQAALWEGERLLERRAYLAASSALADAFAIAGEREELVKGLHHLAAAGYRAQTGEGDRARRQLERARLRLAAFPEATGFSTDYRPMIEGMSPEQRLEQLSSKRSPFNLNEAAASEV